MKNLFLGALLTAILSIPARAVDPKTLESDYNWNTYASSFTNSTTKTIDIAGFGTVGYSSVTSNIVGFDYYILPIGSSATFTVTVTTKTPNAASSVAGFNTPSPFGLRTTVAALSTTTAITVYPGTTMRDAYYGHFQALSYNPVFTFSSLTTNSTYFIYVEYGTQKKP